MIIKALMALCKYGCRFISKYQIGQMNIVDLISDTVHITTFNQRFRCFERCIIWMKVIKILLVFCLLQLSKFKFSN